MTHSVTVVRSTRRVVVRHVPPRTTVVRSSRRVVVRTPSPITRVVRTDRRVVVRGTGAQGPAGAGSSDTYTSTAAQDLAAGDFCYTDGTGLIALALADATSRQCTGFVKVASLTGAPATIYWEGLNTALTALTPGARYYLSDTTAGASTLTPVASGTGEFHQYLGRAVTTTTLSFEAADMIRLRAA